MPQHPSQDLDARFSVFLNPIRDLTKNWEVDIAKYLEDYLVELSEIQITFDGGVTVMNFAEAAMLIQGSATVYSKKVEFLWQMVLQMLDLLSSKRSLDLDADDGPKIGGGRASKHSQTLLFEKMNDVTTGKHIDLKLEDEEEDKKIDFKYLPAMPLHLVEKEGEKSGMRIPLYLKNNESFGNKEDYRINRSYLTTAGLLCLDLPHELLQQNVGVLHPAVPGALNDSVAGFFASEGVDIQAEAVALSSPTQDEAPDADMLDDGVDHGGGFDEMDHESETEPSLNELPVDPPLDPPLDLLLEGVAQGAVADPAPREKNVVEKETSQIVDVVNGRCGLRKRGAKEKIAEVKLTDPLKPLDPHVETPAKRPIRAGRIRRPLPCNCHKEPAKRNSRARKNALKNNDNLLNTKIISVEKFITKDLVNFIANNNNIDAKNSLIDPRVLQEFATEQAKKQEKMKKERVKEVVKKGVPEDEAKERVDEEDELMKTVMEERCEDDVFDNDVPNLDFDHIENGEEEFLLPDPHNDIVTPFGIIRSDDGGASEHPDSGGRGGLNDSLLYEPGSEYEALVQKWVSDYITNAQEHIASSDITKRVNKWKKRIGPKLIEEEERKAFDIHEYGSYVLSHFPSDDEGGHVLFSEVGQNEDRREVSRIFLSCLMLANTYNIELSNTRDGDLEMDCLQLKLLSRVRHHQELDEYAAAAQHARPSSPTRVRRPISPPYSKKKKNKRRKVQTSSSDDSDDSFCPTDQVGEVVAKNQKCSSKTRKSKKQKALRENS